jgi:soluble lytic murein transglycosylase-like protein
MGRFTRFSLLTALAFGISAGPAMADIYSFKDERGVVHFTNIGGLDKRYKLLRREAGNPGPSTMSAGAPVFMPSAADIQRYSSIVDSASKAYGVEKALVHAVIFAESGYNQNALSKAGAMGLMQLMPETARRYGVQNIMDPAQNIHGGVRYLRDLLAMFSGNLELAVAAYNAGENAVIRHGRRVPPYTETVAYVPKVLGFYKKFQTRAG